MLHTHTQVPYLHAYFGPEKKSFLIHNLSFFNMSRRLGKHWELKIIGEETKL